MNTRNQLLCIHLVIPFVLLVGVGGFVLSGFIPPPSPSLSVGDTAALLTPDHLAMRIGVSLLAGGFFLWIILMWWYTVRAIKTQAAEG